MIEATQRSTENITTPGFVFLRASHSLCLTLRSTTRRNGIRLDHWQQSANQTMLPGRKCTGESERRRMSLNKKQQKQIEAAKNKIQRLQTLLSAARKQPDDPQEIPRLEKQIAELNAEIEKIKKEG